MYRRDRINERDVPESQHTIFIRGLPGAMTTEEIRSFFANDGTCSFDFVKVSPDRTKLYVAVRFDSKNSAREVMEKYGKDGRGEILGHEVELSWFRDIRRYIAHCAKQGIAPSRFNSSGGSSGGRRVFRNDDGYRPRGRRSRSVSPLRTTRTRSRSSQQNSNHSQSRSRSNSMSPDENDDDRRRSAGSRSRSPTGEPDDRGRRSRSPSKSVSSVASSGGRSDRHKSADYSDIKKERSPTPPPIKRSKQKKKEKKAERKRRRHHHQSPSQSPVRSGGHGGGGGGMDGGSDMEASEGEIVPSPKGGGKNGKASASMMITSSKSIGPNKPPEAFYQQQILQKQQTVVTKQEQQRQSPPKTYTFRNIPDGSVATGQNNVKTIKNEVAMLAAAAVTNTQQNQQVQPDSSSGYGIGGGGGGQNSTTNNNSKFRQTLFTVDLDNPSNVTTKYSSINGSGKAEDMMAKRPRLDASPPNVQSSAASATIRNSAPLTSSSPLRESGPLAGSVFKDIQRQILQDVRYKPQPDAEEENLGGLRLSALSRQRMTDDMREEKVAKLSPEMRERVAKKKRQLELSYRHDCETFGLVTRKLIEKDRTLEDRLKLALLDTMKDLEGETLKQLDEFLDQLSFIY